MLPLALALTGGAIIEYSGRFDRFQRTLSTSARNPSRSGGRMHLHNPQVLHICRILLCWVAN